MMFTEVSLNGFGYCGTDAIITMPRDPEGLRLRGQTLASMRISRSCPFCLEKRIVCSCSHMARIRGWEGLIPSAQSWVPYVDMLSSNVNPTALFTTTITGPDVSRPRFIQSGPIHLYFHGGDMEQRVTRDFIFRLVLRAFQPWRGRPLLEQDGTLETWRGIRRAYSLDHSDNQNNSHSAIQREPTFEKESEEKDLEKYESDDVAGVQRQSSAPRKDDKKRYRCKLCTLDFAHPSSLSRHSRRVHRGVIHACAECGVTFGTLYNLRRHERVVHRGYRSFACSECDSTFVSHFNLIRHQGEFHAERAM